MGHTVAPSGPSCPRISCNFDKYDRREATLLDQPDNMAPRMAAESEDRLKGQCLLSARGHSDDMGASNLYVLSDLLNCPVHSIHWV